MYFQRYQKTKELIDSQKNGLIKIITGVRRCGKSFLLNTIFKQHLLLSGKYDENHIISFAFDREEDLDKLREFSSNKDVKIKNGKSYLVDSFVFRKFIASKINDKDDYVLMLDEIQFLDEFVGTLNSYLDKPNIDVYVTGSNSRFLSSDIATEFRGRGDVIYLPPLTFKEIYNEKVDNKQACLDEYLLYGGLPLTVLSKTPEKKMSYLKTVFETTYKKDVLDKIRDSNEKQIDELVSLISSSTGSLLNAERIKNTFKSKEHVDIASNTINSYLSLLSDSFLIKESKRYDIKGKKYISTPSKFYFVDTGLRNAIIDFRQLEKNHLMENVIFNELIARGFCVDVGSVSVYEQNDTNTYSKKSLEVDFVANKGYYKVYIQSAYVMEESAKKEQEERPLLNINDGFNKIIVVYDDVMTHYNENGHLVVGLANFLLDESILKYNL